MADGENRDVSGNREIVAAGQRPHFPSVDGESRGATCASFWARGEAPSGEGEFSDGPGVFFTSASFGRGDLGRCGSMLGTISIKISRSARQPVVLGLVFGEAGRAYLFRARAA
jgi:hypothetical protein